MQHIQDHVGLDLHKDAITDAVVSRESGEVRSLGRVPNDLTRLLRRLEPLGEPATAQVCSEAGPTGYVLYREIKETHSKRQLNSIMLRHGRIIAAGMSVWIRRHFDWIKA